MAGLTSRRLLAAVVLALLSLGAGLEWTVTDYRSQATLVAVTQQPPAGFQVLRVRPAPARLVGPAEPRQAGQVFAVPEGAPLRELEERLNVTVRVLDQSAGGAEQTIWLESLEGGTVRYSVYQVTPDGWIPLRFAEVPPSAWQGSLFRGARAALVLWLGAMLCWLLADWLFTKPDKVVTER